MKDQTKTKAQLIAELTTLRQQVVEYPSLENDHQGENPEWRIGYELLHSIINAINDPIVLIGTDYEVKLMNPAARKNFLVGKTAEPLYCYQMLHMRDKSCDGSTHPCPLVQVRKNLRPVTVVHEHVRADGTTSTVEIIGSPLLGGDGTFTGIVESVRDITERVRLEKALRESEERYRSIVENAHAGILIVDDAYRFIYINDITTRILGYPRKEILGQDFRQFLDEESKRLVTDRYTRRQRGEKVPTRYEFNVLQKDGEKRRVEISSTIIKDSKGKVRTVAQILDITEQREAEKALREAEEQFRTIFENTMIGLYRTTPDGRILMANPALVRMLGYSSFDELTQRNLERSGFEPEYQRSTFKQRIEHEGRVIGLESAWETRDGTTLFIRESARAVKDQDGETQYYEGTVEDITNRKRAEEALQKLKDELEVRVERRTAELNISHERLRQEIIERKQVEKSLRTSERQLSKQNITLQEKNIALREMTEQLRAEKERIEGQVVTNIDNLLLPILTKLREKASSLDRTHIILLEENVKRLISPFGNTISRKMLGLTPKEIEICNMIRSGLTSKEIARLTHSSHRTVERHRNNIRKKLGLTRNKINLTSYLQKT